MTGARGGETDWKSSKYQGTEGERAERKGRVEGRGSAGSLLGPASPTSGCDDIGALSPAFVYRKVSKPASETIEASDMGGEGRRARGVIALDVRGAARPLSLGGRR